MIRVTDCIGHTRRKQRRRESIVTMATIIIFLRFCSRRLWVK